MNRNQKQEVVTQLQDALSGAEATFLINYHGASVPLLESLRAALRDKNASFKVAKARLMKKAAADIAGGEQFSKNFSEQVGLVFASQDVTAVAKELMNFAKQNTVLKVISGFYQNAAMTKEEVAYFASLPSREVVLAQVLGTLQAPIATFVRLLQMLIQRLLYVLERIAEKKSETAA